MRYGLRCLQNFYKYEAFALCHFLSARRLVGTPQIAPAAPRQARKGRTDGRLRHENGYQVALALRGELGAGCAVMRLGVEFAEIAVSAQRIRSFPYPSKGNSAPLKVARISRRYEQRTRLKYRTAPGRP